MSISRGLPSSSFSLKFAWYLPRPNTVRIGAVIRLHMVMWWGTSRSRGRDWKARVKAPTAFLNAENNRCSIGIAWGVCHRTSKEPEEVLTLYMRP